MVYRKGQSTTEVVILLAVVMLVALSAVALLSFNPGFLSGSRLMQSKLYWENAKPLSLTEWNAYSGAIRLNVKNSGNRQISLTGVVLTNSLSNVPITTMLPAALLLEPGAKGMVDADADFGNCGGAQCPFRVKLIYTITGTSLSKSQIGREVLYVVPPEGGCGNAGASCSSNSDCCSPSYKCDDNTQKCASCLSNGATCSAGNDCCSDSCSGGKCACLPNGQLCSTGSECCGGVCETSNGTRLSMEVAWCKSDLGGAMLA